MNDTATRVRPPLTSESIQRLNAGDVIFRIEDGERTIFRESYYRSIQMRVASERYPTNSRRVAVADFTAYPSDGRLTMPLARILRNQTVWRANGRSLVLGTHTSGAYFNVSDSHRGHVYTDLYWFDPTGASIPLEATLAFDPAQGGVVITGSADRTQAMPQARRGGLQYHAVAAAPAKEVSAIPEGYIEKAVVAQQMKRLATEHDWCDVARNGLKEIGIDWPGATIDVVVSYRVTLTRQGMENWSEEHRRTEAERCVTVNPQTDLRLENGFHIQSQPTHVRISARN